MQMMVEKVARFQLCHQLSWIWEGGVPPPPVVAKDTTSLHSEHSPREGARGATSVFLWEIELSAISHCDSQADHTDNSISRGCVPVRQQAS